MSAPVTSGTARPGTTAGSDACLPGSSPHLCPLPGLASHFTRDRQTQFLRFFELFLSVWAALRRSPWQPSRPTLHGACGEAVRRRPCPRAHPGGLFQGCPPPNGRGGWMDDLFQTTFGVTKNDVLMSMMRCNRKVDGRMAQFGWFFLQFCFFRISSYWGNRLPWHPTCRATSIHGCVGRRAARPSPLQAPALSTVSPPFCRSATVSRRTAVKLTAASHCAWFCGVIPSEFEK